MNTVSFFAAKTDEIDDETENELFQPRNCLAELVQVLAPKLKSK